MEAAIAGGKLLLFCGCFELAGEWELPRAIGWVLEHPWVVGELGEGSAEAGEARAELATAGVGGGEVAHGAGEERCSGG